MAFKVKINDKEYEIENVSDDLQRQIEALNLTERKLREKANMLSIFNRAKNSYVASLRNEILESKTGFFIEE